MGYSRLYRRKNADGFLSYSSFIFYVLFFLSRLLDTLFSIYPFLLFSPDFLLYSFLANKPLIQSQFKNKEKKRENFSLLFMYFQDQLKPQPWFEFSSSVRILMWSSSSSMMRSKFCLILSSRMMRACSQYFSMASFSPCTASCKIAEIRYG